MCSDCCGSAARNVLDSEESHYGLPVLVVETAPEPDQGKFVPVFEELARQWAAKRNAPAKQMVKRNLKVIR